MTIYTQLTVNGSIINDADSITVLKATSNDNISSSFTAKLDNFNGRNSNEFEVGDEIEIYADVDVNPPTSKLFNGILENIQFPSKQLKETVTLSGKDYTARLIDRTVEPEVYTNLLAGSIVKDIIEKYTDEITVNNVENSSTTISRIAFNHTSVYDAIKKLADLSEFNFFVDEDKDLHFKSEGAVDSGFTFNSGNVTRADFKEQRDTVFNEVWVYGDRYLDGTKEEFIAGSPLGGSVFTLENRPHNTDINVGSPITLNTKQVGAIENISTVPLSGTDYMVNFFDSKIIFVSGTDLGYSSIPPSGTLVTIEYKRSLPIVKVGRNQDSINNYGKRIKKIVDTEIKDPETAVERLNNELTLNSEPKKQGTVVVKNLVNVTPSQTATVNLPNQDVDSKTYEMIEARYNFNTTNNLNNEVLSIKLNKKINDITDTIKDLINNITTIQSQDITDSDILTRLETATGSLGIRHSGLEVSIRPINDSFIDGHSYNGVLGAVNPSSVGSLISGVSWISGNMGTGYDKAIDIGSPSYVIGGNLDSSLNAGSPVSFSYWFNPYINGFSTQGYNSQPMIMVGYVKSYIRRAYNDVIVRVDNAISAKETPAFSLGSSTGLNQWYHHIGILNSGTQIQSWVNGSFIGSNDFSLGGSPLTPYGYNIGRANVGINFSGAFDDLRIYNRVLDASEIGSLYNKQNIKPGLLAYYKFDEGVGSFAYNSASVEMPTGDANLHFRFNQSGTVVTSEVNNYSGLMVGSASFDLGIYNNGSSLKGAGVTDIGSLGYLYGGELSIATQTMGSGDSVAWWGKINSFASGFSGASSYRNNHMGFGMLSTDDHDSCLDFLSNSTQLQDKTGNTYTILAPIGSGEWKQFGYTFDNTGTLFYLNGSYIGSAGAIGSNTVEINRIGRTYANLCLDGNVDEFKIYNKILSQSEIRNLYKGKTMQPLLGDRRSSFTVQYSGGYP